MSAKITLNRKEIEEIILYLRAASQKIHHVNHALFDPKYESKLDWNSEQDRKKIKISLFIAVSSINREIQELEEKVR